VLKRTIKKSQPNIDRSIPVSVATLQTIGTEVKWRSRTILKWSLPFLISSDRIIATGCTYLAGIGRVDPTGKEAVLPGFVTDEVTILPLSQ
jgi:hypothetical protein